MSLVSIFLILISASIHVWWNYLTKSSQNPKVFSLFKGTVLMVLVAMTAFYFPLSKITKEIWMYIVISGVVHGFYILSLSSAYEIGDISYIYPIARSAPAFVPLAAFIALGEKISLRGGIGILIVMISIYVLLMRGDKPIEFHRFWESLKRKDSLWAFATLGTVVTYTIVDKAAMLAFHKIETIAPMMQGLIFYLLENTICYFLFWIYIILRSDQKLLPIWAHEWPKAVAAAISTMVSYSLILYVMRIEKVSYIVTLRQTSVFFAVLVGWLVLKEKYGKIRLLASVVMCLGFYLVSTAR